MQVPVKNPGVGMQGMGDVRAGPYADAAHFGADNYRDLYNFGGAVQHVGNSLLAEAQRRKKREDDAFVRDAVNQAQTRYLEESKGIFGKSSVDAKNAPEEMDKLLQGMRKDLEKNLQNANQRRAFEDAWASLSNDAKGRAIIHRNKQMDIYDKQTHMAQNLTVAKKSAEAVLQPGGVDAVLNGPSLEVIRINTDALTEGQPPEARELARTQAFATFHQAQINSLATLGPEAVLDYLERDKVKEAFSTAEWKGLRDKYAKEMVEDEQKAIVDAGTSRMIKAVRTGGDPSAIFEILVDEVGLETAAKIAAGYKTYEGLAGDYAKRQESAAEAERKADKAEQADREERGNEVLTRSAKAAGREAGTLSAKEARDKAYAEFPEKYAEIMIAAAEAERRAITAEKAETAIRTEEQLGEELKAAGYSAVRMPSYAKLSPEEQKKWLDLGKGLGEATARKEPVDEAYYLSTMFDKSAEEVAAIFADPERRGELAKRLGGIASQQYRDVAARVRGSGAGASAKGGSKSDKIKSLDTILNNLKTEAEMVFADTGRFAGTDAAAKAARDDAMNSVLSYARHEFEASMKRHRVDDIDALPLEERNRIYSEAIITHEIDEWGTNPQYTRAEAWRRGIDTGAPNVSIVGASLPVHERNNLLPQGEIMQRGAVRFQEDIPLTLLPENVRIAAAQERGTVSRNLANGVYVVTPHAKDRPRILFEPKGVEARVEAVRTSPTNMGETATFAVSNMDAIIDRVDSAGGIGLKGRE